MQNIIRYNYRIHISQARSGYFFLFFTIDFLQKYVLKKANKFQMMEIIQNFKKISYKCKLSSSEERTPINLEIKDININTP